MPSCDIFCNEVLKLTVDQKDDLRAHAGGPKERPTPSKEVRPLTWRDEVQNKKRFKMAQNRVTAHNDPLVTLVIVNNCEVQRILVDTGSALDIMYYHYIKSLGLDHAFLQKYDGSIYGFNNQSIPVEGVLKLNVAFNSGRTYVTPSVWFLVVKMPSSFNSIIERPTLIEIRAVVSQSHLYMKFPTPMGDKQVTPPTPTPTQPEVPTVQQVMGVDLPDNRPDDEARATPIEEVEEVGLDHNDPTKKTQIGTKLDLKEREELINFLKSNRDLKKGTYYKGERLQGIKEEVQKLLQARFVRRVNHCEWVTNPVLVKKSNDKWRMCIDYTNLNEACLKDCHPLPSIDKLVEAAFGNKGLSLLNAYLGYHQVHMAPKDEGETFDNFRKHNMKLNPAKCVFGVEFGKFLGLLVSMRGIKVNPEKIKAIEEMKPPKLIKDVQRLIGRVAALHRFISKAVDKCLPFFKVLRYAAQKDETRKPKKFKWTLKCQTSFDELKAYLSSPPLLTKAKEGEILYLYLGLSDTTVSSILIREMG
ncbi:hypothetical protein SLEP1_g18724 [Rubroshorea leprosula]|uniref:Reverse transcriptase domain-containing protein n=1 Tax=Rubroshorea leprosula TaxID=152421 RepID=A0AAV5J7R5_9ROSI|nr:hypothetical protein SLEP1_g18724 [Rubroshorea leprosula]